MYIVFFFFLMILRPPRSTLFPYTTLFRFAKRSRESEPLVIESISAMTVPFMTAKRFADRKSTRLNSSHANISYAVFCLKKKKTISLYDEGSKNNTTTVLHG